MLTPSTGTTYTRVAVVQIAYHPAALVDRRSPLEDPLFDPRGGDALAPRGEVPDALAADLAALRRRVRDAHNDQLLGKLRAVLAACRGWGVRLVVLPEYSVPWEILGGVADAAGDMVVVAGTHAVDRAARKSGVYERLVAPALPALGSAVCPVLHQGRLLSLQAKLHPALPERGSMKEGAGWVPVEMPAGVPGPLGVLVCLDFLFRESAAYRDLVGGALGGCRFLAVPSLTPHYTLPEFAGKAWEEARRYGRPVLYCDGAEGGGTAVYVDEGQPHDLRRFPDRAGYLEPGDEGVIVADVNLGYERPGGSTRYDQARPVVPVAEATFVYRGNAAGRAYAGWLGEAAELLARDDDDALEALVDRVGKGRDVLLNAGALTGAAARGRRMRRLLQDVDRLTRVEEVRQFTREVVLPEGLVPLSEVRKGMTAGAADAVFGWMTRAEARAVGFGEVEARLREAGKGGDGGIAAAVRGVVEGDKKAEAGEVPARVVLPEGVDPAALGVQRHGEWTLSFQARPDDFGNDTAMRWANMLLGLGDQVKTPDRLVRKLLSLGELGEASDLYLLTIAQGVNRTAVVTAWPSNEAEAPKVLVVSAREKKWIASSVSPLDVATSQGVLAALVASGLESPILVPVSEETLRANISALSPAFAGAGAVARSLREQRLREVSNEFVEPDASIGGESGSVLGMLDAWLVSGDQTALVLGEFGVGKSTVLAQWAHDRWEQGKDPLPILVNLAGVGPTASPDALLLQAARLDDLPKHRAALRLLIRYGHLVPCFDGFDEMATRLEAAELAGRLAALLEVASGGGKVLISSRTNYFPSKEHLRTAADAALVQALGASAGVRRLEIQPFSDEQVAALVRKIRTEEGAADKALDRIAHIYDLRDLVHRPLLLAMVLNTLDSLDDNARVGRADLYEAYVAHWLTHTRKDDPECFTDTEKMAFAEALAEQLWRSGQPSCTWQELHKSVRLRLVPVLREGMPVGAALLEMQGGAFFVHEGEDRYRFAHKSFLEFFMARALVGTAADRPAEVLATKPITPEVAAFVWEILRRAGDPRESRAVRAVSAWLTKRPDPAPEAAANAVRLLLGLARWADDGKAWMPEGADLRRVSLVKESLRGAVLVRADLSGADLSGADLSNADLSEATLDGARIVGATLDKARLVRANGRGADFTLVEADEVDLFGADLTEAVLRQSMWTSCRWEGVKCEGAEVTGWSAPGAPRAFGRDGPFTTLSPALASALATGHGGIVTAVAWSPDGSRLVSGGHDNTVRLWDAAAGTEIARLEGHTNRVMTVAWSPDGSRLVSGGHDNTVRLWDAAAGTEIARLEGHTNWVMTMAWSPDGMRLVSGGNDNTVRLWDAAAGTEVVRFEGHTSGVSSVAWSPDGTRLVSGGYDNTVRLWDVAAGTEIARLGGHANGVMAVAWSPDGTRLVSGGYDNTLRLWDAAAGTEIARLEGHTDWVQAVAWSPDGSRLVSAGMDTTVRLWDVTAGTEIARLEGHTGWVNTAAWSPDGLRLVSGGSDKTVRFWDAAAGTEIARLNGYTQWASAAAWSPDGTRLVSGGDDKTVRLWDAATGIEIARFKGHTNSVNVVAWSPDGTRLVSGGDDNTVRLWDVAAGTEIAQLEGHTGGVGAVAWSPDGTRLVSGGDDKTVRLWDAAAGTEIAQLEDHTDWVKAVAWSPDGTRLVSGGHDKTVQLWDVAAGTEIARLEGHTRSVKAVAWSLDGTRLVSGGDDNTVRLWDVAAGTEIARLEGHTRSVTAVAWSPDGTRLVSGGYDKTVRLWDVAAGTEIARLEGHTRGVSAVAWSSDGTRLMSAGRDGTIRIWDARRAIPLAILEAAGPSTLTRTPGGFAIFNDTPAVPARLTVGRTLYLPLAGLRRVLHRPDKVRAALAGDLSGDDPRPELERLGWTNGIPWDGKPHRISRAPEPALEEAEHAPLLDDAASHDIPKPAIVAVPPPASDPLTFENPFRPGRALVESITLPGRDPVLSDLLTLIQSKSPALLRGPRRSGKTSILYHVKARLVSTHAVWHVTLEGHDQPLRTGDDLAVSIDPTLQGTSRPAEALRTKLRQQSDAVLLLDEVANLASAEASLFSWLRAIGQEGTSVILAGSHWDWVRVVERAAAVMPGSSFGNDVTVITLGPLRDADALGFLTAAAPPDVPLARDGTAQWILDLCGPWPFYLQVMGFAVVQAVREGERKALVEQAGVRDLYEQRLLLDRSDGYFATRFAELPQRAQRVLETVRALPVGEHPVYRELPPEDRRILRDTGICTAQGAWIRDPPFFDWIRRIRDDGRR